MDNLFVCEYPDSIIPTIATSGSAGYDLYSYEDIVIPKMSQVLIDTGIRSNFEPGAVFILKSRSGLCSKFNITTEAGVIDSDYKGIIKVILRNFSSEDYHVKKGDKISQGIFVKLDERYYMSSEVSKIRGDCGFGSTG